MSLLSLFNRLLGRGRKPRPSVKTVTRRVEHHVLSQEQYSALEKSLPGTGLMHGESGEQYAFNLGVQHALRKLREGYVVDVPNHTGQD